MTGYPNAKVTYKGLNIVYIEAGGKQDDFQKWLSGKLAEED